MSKGEEADERNSSGSQKESQDTETPVNAKNKVLPKISMFSQFANSPTFSPSREKHNVLMNSKNKTSSMMTSKFAGIFGTKKVA